MVDVNKIKERLGQEIKYCALSQSEIAKQVGISQQQVSCYLLGKKMPALDTFAKLCQILNADPAYILGLTN
ncbi:MAG: helix-turn-helix domain-containing protein [Clostridia bacterium]|nr:helix-turn-helix domain-containing protein [Clostridia bacterium]